MTPEIRALFERTEAGNKGYNAYNRGTRTDKDGQYTIVPANRDIDFSALTLKDVMALQALPKSNAESVFAVGLYQMTPSTLKSASGALKLDPDARFDEALQDRIFSDYLMRAKRPAIEAYIKDEGKNSLKAAQHDLSKEWAGMPDPYKDGASHYGKGTSNKAQVSLDVSQDFLEGMRADYAALRKTGLDEQQAWAGLFDGRRIERLPAEVATPVPSKSPGATAPAPGKRPKDDEPDFMDKLGDLPIFKSMETAVEKLGGMDIGQSLDRILEKVTEGPVLQAIGKATDSLASLPDKGVDVIGRAIASSSTRIEKITEAKPVEAEASHETLGQPSPSTQPKPSRTEAAKATAPSPSAAPSPKAAKPTETGSLAMQSAELRLLYQVEAHLAGDAGRHLGHLDEAGRQRLAHALVAEARVSGFRNVAEVRATRDGVGLIAFDGASDSPASRRLYVDRAQAEAQPLARSAALIQELTSTIDAAAEMQKPLQMAQRH